MTLGNTTRLGRRDQLLVEQAHAAQHALARLGLAPACTGSPPPLAAISHFPCPTCMAWVPVTDRSEEHAPVQSGSPTMGAATTAVITCKTCNNEPGKTYEKNADANKYHPALDLDVPGITCHLHGPAKVEHKATGLFIVRDELPFARTDFKAGYLLAFAALGYTWAADPALDAARTAITPAADRPPAREHGYLAHTEMPGSPHEHDNVVINIAAPAPCVIVRAATGTSIILPAPGQRTVPTDISGTITAQTFPWPSTAFVQGRDITQTRARGHLFHLDLCNHQAHQPQQPAPRRWTLNQGLWLPTATP